VAEISVMSRLQANIKESHETKSLDVGDRRTSQTLSPPAYSQHFVAEVRCFSYLNRDWGGIILGDRDEYINRRRICRSAAAMA